ncbi:MAG: ABC transporter substrate-binding protein [Syntrophobacteraceae bacterium]|nr:ABC transporter substrate-binding protein [Syntrophobacteraceae bacterium]
MLVVRQWKFVLFASLLTVLWAAGPVRADSGAGAKVRSVLDKAMAIQTDPKLEGAEHRKERAAQVRKLIAQNFLSSEMAKESLQEYWGRITASQKERYRTLLTAIFIDSYTRQVVDFLKQEKIQYPGQTPEGKFTKVKTVIMRTDEHIPVDYIMEQSGGQWKIRDVLIDGVGIVDTYKSSFSTFLRSHTFNDLISRMSIQKQAGEGL